MSGPRSLRFARAAGWAVVLAALAVSRSALAGPPYTTDDPVPVPLHGWELYLSATRVVEASDRTGDAPHVEVNYGAAPGLQLHAVVPLGYARPAGGPTTFGLGDVEVGAKLRFVEETDRQPQVGVFPLVELPTGDAARGLGAGQVAGRAVHGCDCAHAYVSYLLTLGPKG